MIRTTDPHEIANVEPRGRIEQYFAARLKDPRDIHFVRVCMLITAFVVPCAVFMYLPGVFRWWMALIYVPILVLKLYGRYLLMLHATAHRPMFKAEHKAWSYYIPWFLGPFFGQTPNSFAVHHVGMHHIENNLLEDVSTTICYRRDNFFHWLHYWAKFFFLGYLHMPVYLWRKGRMKMFKQFVGGELAWYAVIGLLFFVNPGATMTVFVIPLLLVRVLFMTGNWGQHAFVDIDDAGNAYRNSTCLTNTRYNHKAYNDGYHIVHHLRPGLHWTEMPKWYEDRIAEFANNDAIVFDGIPDNQTIWFCLMTGNYDKLAKHVVDLGEHPRTHAEKVEWLKGRVQRQARPVKGFFELPNPAVPEAAAAK